MAYEEINSSHPVGRKDYRCEWCNEVIPKGEQHLHRTYKFEGDFNSGRMHLECEKAMEQSPWDEVADGWLAGEPKRGVTLDGKPVTIPMLPARKRIATEPEVELLYNHLAHGDAQHRHWLYTELRKFFGLCPHDNPAGLLGANSDAGKQPTCRDCGAECPPFRFVSEELKAKEKSNVR